jgi:hypothetical protein
MHGGYGNDTPRSMDSGRDLQFLEITAPREFP